MDQYSETDDIMNFHDPIENTFTVEHDDPFVHAHKCEICCARFNCVCDAGRFDHAQTIRPRCPEHETRLILEDSDWQENNR